MWTLNNFSLLKFFFLCVGGCKTSKHTTLEYKDEVIDKDNYSLICYRIKLEDKTEIVETELTEKDLNKIEENNKISYIIIEYMFNGNLLKYITRQKNLTFPIYEFKVEKPTYLYYPETIILNDLDITDYLTPFLGPLCNFYKDRDEPINLKDALIGHPDYDKINFEEGKLIMISNTTPLNGKKIKISNLPCELVWKRHAAVDPRDDGKLYN